MSVMYDRLAIKKYVDLIEDVQRKFTKFLTGMYDKSYRETIGPRWHDNARGTPHLFRSGIIIQDNPQSDRYYLRKFLQFGGNKNQRS